MNWYKKNPLPLQKTNWNQYHVKHFPLNFNDIVKKPITKHVAFSWGCNCRDRMALTCLDSWISVEMTFKIMTSSQLYIHMIDHISSPHIHICQGSRTFLIMPYFSFLTHFWTHFYSLIHPYRLAILQILLLVWSSSANYWKCQSITCQWASVSELRP